MDDLIKVNGHEIVFAKFPNNETNLNTDNIKDEFYYKVIFKYEDDSDLIKLMLLKGYLDNMKTNETVKRVDLKITHMPYSRMDRSENGSPFTLKYVANFINGLGFNEVEIVEPHSNVTTALVDKSHANFINFPLTEYVMDEVNFNFEEDFVMFPDNGAANRYKDMKFNNVLIGHKNRDFATGEIKNLELVGNASQSKGKKVLIVDDLSSYGGTFVYSAKALRDSGFKEVYLLIAHAENSIFKGKLFDHIDKVFTTDSMLTEHTKPENKRLLSQLVVYDIERFV